MRGLRFPVSRLLGLLPSGETRQTILDTYPYLEAQDIEEALRYADGWHGQAERSHVFSGNKHARSAFGHATQPVRRKARTQERTTFVTLILQAKPVMINVL